MNLRNLFKYGLMAIFIFQNAIQNAIGMESDQDDKLLVIGCRPWDKNMERFSGLRTAHFIDFMDIGAPSIIPPNFYHLDVNDTGLNSSGKFSNFANNNIGKYKTIIIDWITYQHIHRDDAWSDFAKLLDINGNLIVPVTFTSFKEGPISFKTAETLINEKNLTNLFNQVNILSYDEIPQDTRFDLLHRPSLEPGRLECHIKMKPAVILAKKQSDPTEDTENLSESEPMTPERREVKIQSLSPTEEELVLGFPIVTGVKAIEEEVKEEVKKEPSSSQPALTGQLGSETPQTPTTVITIKNSPENERIYQERYNKEKHEESYAHCLRALARIYEEQQMGEKDSEPRSVIRPPAYIKEYGEHVKLLRDNVERNKGVIEWIDAEFRWPRETESRDFLSLQAIRNTYTKAAGYVQVATNPERTFIHAEGDDRACKNMNQYMEEEIGEWINQELMQKLVKKGFFWQ